MSRRRLERVTELIHQEVSKNIHYLKAPGLGFITVLAVRLSPDFTQARVYYSVIGSADEKQRTQVALDRAKTFFRSKLRHLESLKTPPELTFIVDNSAEEAQQVLSVLSDLEKERRDQHSG